jgi:hypothetical protein
MVQLGRTARVVNQVRAVWKFCLSFRKRSWDFTDYPVSMRVQEQGTARHGSRFALPRYVASIVNWHLSGTGDSEAEALRSLQSIFAIAKSEREEKGESLPRPGSRVPIEFASQDRVSAHRELAEDFIRRVLELEWAWISDASTLWDFCGEETNDKYYDKIKEVYGVDVSDIQSAKLCEVLERIAAVQATKG